MSSELYRIQQRKRARDDLRRLFDNADSVVLVHYSCESFYKQEDGASPRISSVSVKFLSSGHTTSFSIFHSAEELGISPSEVWTNYPRIERKLLDDFFTFVREHQGYTWAHWNMRSMNFGFQALEHRYRVLGGDPVVVKDARKVDLSQVMHDIYGVEYCEKPVLANLCAMNDIKSEFFLPGAQEAEAFSRGEFKRLQQSTMKKVDFISYVAEKAHTKELKTNSKWYKSHAVHPKVVLEVIRSHWGYTVAGLALLVLGWLRYLGIPLFPF